MEMVLNKKIQKIYTKDIQREDIPKNFQLH